MNEYINDLIILDSSEALIKYLSEPEDIYRNLPVDAYDFICAIYPIEQGGIINACCIFADNLVKVSLHDPKAGIKFGSSSDEYKEMRQRFGLELNDNKIIYGGRTVIVKQFNELVKLMFHIEIRMINADIKYLERSFLQARKYADYSDGFIRRTKRTIVNRILYTMHIRYNHLPYSFQQG